MKTLLVLLWPVVAFGQLELVSDAPPPAVFAGKAQVMRVAIRNPGAKTVELDATLRLFQATSGSVVPLGEARPWKKLQVLPKQTVLEDIPVTLPAVRAATRFRLDCPGLGRVMVTGYPEDLLKGLTGLAGGQPIAVVDPDNKLKSLLQQSKVEFADYEVETPESRLAVVWSTASSLPEPILTRVKRGLAVVWIRPQKISVAALVRLEAGTVMMVPAASVAALAESPLAQMNLLHCAELALQPEALRLLGENQPTERNEK